MADGVVLSCSVHRPVAAPIGKLKNSLEYRAFPQRVCAEFHFAVVP